MNGVSLEQAGKEVSPTEVKPRTTLQEHLQYHYNKLMTEYTETDKRLKDNQDKKKNIDREMDNNEYCYRGTYDRNGCGYRTSSYKEWQDNGRDYPTWKSEPRKSIDDICSTSKYHDLLDNIKKDTERLPIVKYHLITLNKKLNNSEHLVSLNRKELNERCDWFVDKTILGVGTNAMGDSNASVHGKIDGGMSGASFLGFGSISGYIDGKIDGNSNAKYEENILIKFKYNLDYKIDELLFNINDYIGG